MFLLFRSHGKSPSFTTIWGICLSFFPTTKQAIPWLVASKNWVKSPTEICNYGLGPPTCKPFKRSRNQLLLMARIPAPVDTGSLSHYLQGFYTSHVVTRISEPSTVSTIHLGTCIQSNIPSMGSRLWGKLVPSIKD